MYHIYEFSVTKQKLTQLFNGYKADIFQLRISNECGILAEGNKYSVKATNMIDFINKKELPERCRITFTNFVCDHHPLKTELYRVRLVVGVNRLVCGYNPGSPAAPMLETKIFLNIIISDAQQGDIFMRCDLKYLLLATPMLQLEYMKIYIRYFPQDIIEKIQFDDQSHIWM